MTATCKSNLEAPWQQKKNSLVILQVLCAYLSMLMWTRASSEKNHSWQVQFIRSKAPGSMKKLTALVNTQVRKKWVLQWRKRDGFWINSYLCFAISRFKCTHFQCICFLYNNRNQFPSTLCFYFKIIG